jgi:hypothetical protein
MDSSVETIIDLQLFASDLRSLREAAGNPSYRNLAKIANYSRTSLAQATNGRVLPSLQVTRAYVSACGGDLQAWESRWHRLHKAIEESVTLGMPSTAAAAASPWPLRPVTDGVDPDEAGCSVDAITVHARRIALVSERTIVGQIELRYCRRTRAAWGRFKGYGYLNHLAMQKTVDVVVEVVRKGDGLCLAYQHLYAFDSQWGDLVVCDGSPIKARAKVLIADEVIAVGETDEVVLS